LFEQWKWNYKNKIKYYHDSHNKYLICFFIVSLVNIGHFDLPIVYVKYEVERPNK